MSDSHILSLEVPPPRHYENVARFKAVTKSYWNRFPEFLAVCLELSHLERATFPQSLNTLAKILNFIFKAKENRYSLPPCPVLLFHSNYKPAYWPALGLLADRLAAKGFACALISSDRMEIRRSSISGTIALEGVPDYQDWLNYGFSHLQALKVVLHAMNAALVLFWLAFGQNRKVLKNLLHDPIGVWYHLTMSAHRFELSRHLWRLYRPRLLLVNHERVPIGAELVMSPAASQAITIQICNEPPHHAILPFLSDEVWVWNNLAACLVEEAGPDGSIPKTVVIGSNEVDVALQPAETPSEAELARRQQAGGKPTLLLLSEYFPGEFYDPHERPLSQKVMAWLGIAAHECPEWHFILKPRQHELGQRPPGTEFLDGLQNFSISDRNVSYRQYLNWDNLRAVAAVSSSGLFAAAGVGKTAIRLAVTPNRYCWPVIEDVSSVVRSPTEFVQVLKFLGTNPASEGSRSRNEEQFPYRGRTVERMEQLCLERLRNGSEEV